jgi:hypothetical protein
MNSWSSFKDDKIIMEAWRSHLDEDIDAKRLAEDLDKELERIDELFGFGKSREDKWKAIAAGEDEEDAAEPADTAAPDGEKEEKRGFFGKMADYAKGIKDISGFFGKGAGTLLGGEETFDIKKRKELKDNAQKELNKWLSNLNYPPISAINNKLFSAQFPNNDKSEFNQQLQMVNQAYDTIASDHEEGKIDTPRANLIIAVMRGMLIYYQDFAIADRYMYVKEQEEDEEEEKMGAEQGAVSKNVASAYSKKLPLGLAAAGTAAMGAGFLANSAWFQDWLLSLRDMTETIEVDEIIKNATKTMDLGEVKPGEGVIKVIRRLVPGKEDFARGTGSNLGFLKDPKNKMVYNLLKTAMGDQPGTDVAAFENLVSGDADAFTTFVSGPMSGRGGTLFAINKGKFQGTFNNIIKKQIQRVKKQPANTTKNWFISNAAKFLGPVLQALGLGALAGAGVSAALRAKGKRSSRMAQLKTLVDTMVDVTPAAGDGAAGAGADAGAAGAGAGGAGAGAGGAGAGAGGAGAGAGGAGAGAGGAGAGIAASGDTLPISGTELSTMQYVAKQKKTDLFKVAKNQLSSLGPALKNPQVAAFVKAFNSKFFPALKQLSSRVNIAVAESADLNSLWKSILAEVSKEDLVGRASPQSIANILIKRLEKAYTQALIDGVNADMMLDAAAEVGATISDPKEKKKYEDTYVKLLQKDGGRERLRKYNENAKALIADIVKQATAAAETALGETAQEAPPKQKLPEQHINETAHRWQKLAGIIKG